MIKRYILTGTPGCGKTSLIRALEVKGYFVIEEAATDMIAHEQTRGIEEPWRQEIFIDQIVCLQKQRQITSSRNSEEIQFYDRSPLCTYALGHYLGFKPSSILQDEIDRLEKEKIYQKKVFFIENLGFCKQTEARKISYEESLAFEKIHLEVYEKFGYDCIKIPPASLLERVSILLRCIGKDLEIREAEFPLFPIVTPAIKKEV
jgi:predicted ATPase